MIGWYWHRSFSIDIEYYKQNCDGLWKHSKSLWTEFSSVKHEAVTKNCSDEVQIIVSLNNTRSPIRSNRVFVVWLLFAKSTSVLLFLNCKCPQTFTLPDHHCMACDNCTNGWKGFIFEINRHDWKFFIINHLDALISQILFWYKFYMFRKVPLSIIRSLFTAHSAMVCVIRVCRQLSSSSIPVLLESCLQTCMTYTIAECTVNKLLTMDRGTLRNM
jgi:hypothetical protein